MSEIAEHTLTLAVGGMTCASCVARVEKALKNVEGVRSANVNLATEKVTLAFDERKTNYNELALAVTKAGYTLLTQSEERSTSPKGISKSVSESRQETVSRETRRDFLFSLFLTIPIMSVSMIDMTNWFMRWSPVSMEDINKLLLIATTVVLVVPGKRFYRSAWQQAKHFSADMNTLIAVGTGFAYVYSALVVLFPHWLGLGASFADVYFDTAATIITLILLGKMLEARAKRKASDAIHKLMALTPAIATVERSGQELVVRLDQVVVGESVIVRPGEKIPVDGLVTFGSTTIDESTVTGESMPVERTVGQKIIGGTINKNGSVKFRATAVGKDTMISHIIKLVEEAQGSKAPIQNLADKIASVFVPVVISIAVATFTLWYFFGSNGFTPAMINAIAVMIIACPCALGLATPTAIIVGTGKGATMGILIKNAESLERARRIQTIVLDKTGTLTLGKPAVTDVVTFDGVEREIFLRYVASAEKKSEHPLGQAVVSYAASKGLPLWEPEHFLSHSGLGITASVEGKNIVIGNSEFLQNVSIDISLAQSALGRLSVEGKTPILVSVDGRLGGVIAIADSIHPSSHDAVTTLQEMGIEVIMLTGDNQQTANAIATQAGIQRVIAEVLPQDKAAHIKEIQTTGKIVAMVGDGINDAPALAQADVGIAMGSGTDIAMETADITLMNRDLRTIPKAIRLSNRTLRTIKQNLFWAFVYNIIGIPLAALGLLSPVVAATAMAFSSVSVISNSLRLRISKI